MASGNSTMGWKLYGTGASIVAGILARKALTFVWTKATGKEPPANPEHPEVTFAEAAGWAILSGIVVALARLVAERQAAHSWHRASGSLPPGMEERTA